MTTVGEILAQYPKDHPSYRPRQAENGPPPDLSPTGYMHNVTTSDIYKRVNQMLKEKKNDKPVFGPEVPPSMIAREAKDGENDVNEQNGERAAKKDGRQDEKNPDEAKKEAGAREVKKSAGENRDGRKEGEAGPSEDKPWDGRMDCGNQGCGGFTTVIPEAMTLHLAEAHDWYFTGHGFNKIRPSDQSPPASVADLVAKEERISVSFFVLVDLTRLTENSELQGGYQGQDPESWLSEEDLAGMPCCVRKSVL